jgi:ABC-type nitrate/sulfonate/bicarbonate transport system substrate-binding protein
MGDQLMQPIKNSLPLLLAALINGAPFTPALAQDTLPTQDSTIEELVVQELPPEEIPVQDLSLAVADKANGYLTPFYWAQRNGAYKEAGINLKLVTGNKAGNVESTVSSGQVPIGITDISTFMQSRSQGADLIAIMGLYNHLAADPHWNQGSGIPLLIAGASFLAAQDDLVRSFVQTTQKAFITCVATPDPCVAAHARSSKESAEQVAEQWQQMVGQLKTPGEQRNRGFGFFDPDIMRQAYTAAQTAGVSPFDITDAYSNAYNDITLRLPD